MSTPTPDKATEQMSTPTRTLEQRLDEWASQPGAIVTQAERTFITHMRQAAAEGVGYGWMQQITEWEWQAKALGSWGPEYFAAELQAASLDARRLREALKELRNHTSMSQHQIALIDDALSKEA